MLDFGANIGSSLVANEISAKSEEYQEHDCPGCGQRYSMHSDMHKLVHLLVEMRDHTRATEGEPIDERVVLQPGALAHFHTYNKKYTLLFAPTATPVIFQVMGIGTTTTITLAGGWNTINLPDGTQFGLPASAPGNVSLLLRATDVLYSGQSLGSVSSLIDIPTAIRNGQSFVANKYGLTGAALLYNCAISLFNPLGSGRVCYIYSLRVLSGSVGGTLSYWAQTTTDPSGTPGYTATAPIHLPGFSTPVSVMSCASTPSGTVTNVTLPVHTEDFLPISGQEYEIIVPGSFLEITPGNGITVIVYVSTVSSYYQACAKWVEV